MDRPSRGGHSQSVNLLLRASAGIALALVVAGCGPAAVSTPVGRTTPDPQRRGGTLRVALLSSIGPLQLDILHPDAFLDTLAVNRCCLSRSLLSYSGQPTEQGGTEPRPDVASALPEVTADGLTWTFRLKPGLHYGPPLESVPIRAADFVRAVERGLSLGPRETLTDLSMIRGVAEFKTGQADTIAGLETPDDQTLVVHLVQPTGDLSYRFSMPDTAPIPPAANGARLGVADGHAEDYADFLVSSGPYRVEQSSQVVSPDGETWDGLLVLVRNLSWIPGSDDLRPAYPDRIEVVLGDLSQLDMNSASASKTAPWTSWHALAPHRRCRCP